MPITNPALYPGGSLQSPQWQLLRTAVLGRARNRCEFCGLINGTNIRRCGEFVCYAGTPARVLLRNDTRQATTTHPPIVWGEKVRVSLAIAHLNQDARDNRPHNLRALCQACHHSVDAPHRAKKAAKVHAKRQTDQYIGSLFVAEKVGA
ncbi:MAG: hypothetical protein K0U36_06865 [Alphaproteobacteria bacterium]|nr:hypothetical protein [Alphaproteobacteria bacterium]